MHRVGNSKGARGETVDCARDTRMAAVLLRLNAPAVALLALATQSAPAIAQEQESSRLIDTPAETFAMAPGGVDMRTGRYAYSDTDLATGGEGSAALTLTRTLAESVPGHAQPFGNFSHNWNIMVSELRVAYDRPRLSGADYRIFVHFGGRSQTYRSRAQWSGFGQESGGGLAPLTYSGDRASSSVVYTYQAADGTVAVFRPLGQGDCSSERRCAFVSQITEPDGTVFTFDYVATGSPTGGAQRLRSVTSSRGYALLFEGEGSRVTKACLVNLALSPLPSSCASGALATATYAYTASAPTRLASATGPDGSVHSFSYAAAAENETDMSFIRPGESAPWLVNRVRLASDEQGIAQEIVERQSFADGRSYTYAHGRAPITHDSPLPAVVGGSYTDAFNRRTEVPFAWPLLHGAGNPGSPCTPAPCPPSTPDDFLNWVYQQTPGPVRITDPLGRTTILNYCDPVPMANLPPGEMNRCVVVPLVSFTDPEGAKTELEYDGHRNVIRVTRRPRPGSTLAPIVTSAVYDTGNPRSASRPLSMTDARGNITTYTYAPEHGGMLTMTGPAPADGGPRPQIRHAYAQLQARRVDGSPAGLPVWVRTQTSSCRTSAATGNSCASAGDEVLTTYDYGPQTGPNTLLLRGQAVTAVDGGVATTLRTCFAYDPLGRRISETGPGAGLTSCPDGPPTAAVPHTASTRYDAAGRVIGTISADPDGTGPKPHLAVRNSYDPAGRLVRVETGTLASWQSENVAPAYWPGFSILRTAETRYDVMGRKVREWVREGPSGLVRMMTETSYDLAGQPACVATRMNPAAFVLAAAPLPDACAAGAPGPDGPDRIVRNLYDAAGQRLQLRVGVGSGAEAAEATWTYNLAGQVTAVIDGNGNRAELRYDGHGRQSCWLFPSPARSWGYTDTTPATALETAGGVNADCAGNGDYEAYGYDPNGNRTSFRRRNGQTIGYGYDALNRLTVKDLPGAAGDTVFGYDLRNLMTHAIFAASGEGIVNAHDGFGRLAASTSTMGFVGRTLSYRYDLAGNRIRITHPDGTFFTTAYDGLNRPDWAYDQTGYALHHYVYDAHGRLVARSQGNGGGNDYGRDALGRLTLMTQVMAGTSADAWITFGYNLAGQLASTSRDNDAYAWTGAQALSRPYAINGLNQYDSAGAPGAEATFDYDANGNLILETPPLGGSTAYTYDTENRLVSASGARNAALRYDPLGRLYEISNGGTATRFLYDGSALVAEYNGNGEITHRYVHGAGADMPLVDYVGASLTQPYYLHADHQGSIVARSGAGAAVQAINAYDEYGLPNPGNQGRFQYTGQIWLAELGMYYFKARIYSPTFGRFLQVDLIGYEDQFNLYAYVRNDPVNLTDPTGLLAAGCQSVTGSRIPDCGAREEAQDFVGEHYGSLSEEGQAALVDSAASYISGSGSLDDVRATRDVWLASDQSRPTISAGRTDSLGYYTLASGVIGGSPSNAIEVVVHHLYDVRIITRFGASTPAGALNPLTGAFSYSFLNVWDRPISGQVISGPIGVPFDRILDIPRDAYRLRIQPFALTPRGTQVIIRGRRL
jgi:RHS repeat-associated protein